MNGGAAAPAVSADADAVAAGFRDALAAFRRAHGEPGRWLVAASGGLDSTVLLHLAVRALPPATLLVAHLHHGLRGADADADADRVAGLARTWEVASAIERAAVAEDARRGRRGIEDAARAARRDFFRRLAAEGPAPAAILLGHHGDDQVETVLFRWQRGAAWRGLGGMRPVCPLPGAEAFLVRPLLELPRSSLMVYARRHGLAWREDVSNADPKYRRNRLRHRVCPRLAAADPSFPGACRRLAAAAGRLDSLSERFAEAWLRRHAKRHDGGVWLPAAALPAAGGGEWRGEAKAYIFRAACERWCVSGGSEGTPRIVGEAVIAKLDELAKHPRRDAQTPLGRGWHARRMGRGIWIGRFFRDAIAPEN